MRRHINFVKMLLILLACALPACLVSVADADDSNSGGVLTTGDFTILGSLASGKTLFVNLPGAGSLNDAITQTADDVGKILDGKPTVTGAFADSASKTKGGALFTGTMNGVNVRGWIFASVSNGGGAAGSVVLANANASQGDIARLFGYLPGQVHTQTYTFPDGSGSIELPDGWTTAQQSAAFGVFVKGPAGQSVTIQSSVMVYTPTCRLVRMSQQTDQMAQFNYANQMRNYQNALQMHQRFPNTMMPIQPTPPAAPNSDPNKRWPQLYFCRLCSGAADVLKYFYPVIKEKQQMAGGPYSTVDKIIEVVPCDPSPQIPGDKVGVAYMAVTDYNGDQATHMRVLNRIETYPIFDGQDEWTIVFNTMRSPDATFDRDLPVMNGIMSSLKLNMDVVNQEIAQSGAAVRKMGQDSFNQMMQRAKDFDVQQAQNFDRFESQIAAQEKAVHDSSSDEIEYVSGVRDVYDTDTGEMQKVDLFNVNGIVQSMNDAANDPNRFVQIPLRYER
ncbi:MAG TPA: hypothetical protein VMD30_11790 [Tepidisphaeraceae bacterium]|nr:hypothetical protein [Tepidisphaeraceae bacterium]